MKTINVESGFVTAAEAFRRLGVKQGGPVKAQAKRVGLRLSGRHGALGGIFLVHEDEIARVLAKREKQAAAEAVEAAPPVVPAPAPAQQELVLIPPGVAVPADSMRAQMDRIEAKLDQLLAIWK